MAILTDVVIIEIEYCIQYSRVGMQGVGGVIYMMSSHSRISTTNSILTVSILSLDYYKEHSLPNIRQNGCPTNLPTIVVDEK